MLVKRNNNAGFDGRPLPWVEDAITGKIVAFVFDRRTNDTFRRLLDLLEQAQISIDQWITDAWWRMAAPAYLDCLDQSNRIQDKSLM